MQKNQTLLSNSSEVEKRLLESAKVKGNRTSMNMLLEAQRASFLDKEI